VRHDRLGAAVAVVGEQPKRTAAVRLGAAAGHLAPILPRSDDPAVLILGRRQDLNLHLPGVDALGDVLVSHCWRRDRRTRVAAMAR
jgi:hypothetical protein